MIAEGGLVRILQRKGMKTREMYSNEGDAASDINVPRETRVWATETPEEATHARRENSSRLKWVRMTLSKDKDSNSKEAVAAQETGSIQGDGPRQGNRE